ncbi:SIR2 family NAD-dependent protein deacylase [Chondrinema litorale]|uniref:SIR2 family NAD-dependent protein deacylase n=1 Tax=Chondrinema litorale TaxID=2994555 RepID=UPI0025427DA7|nr:NAD-dependent deacylase [Chondrinema litorale]UZR93957.1 NAD-dependent deacylase [Chondrinema litorale]
MKKKKLIVLSGAGISAESGIATFRASNGLWEGHDVNKVATYDGWLKDKELVLNFYNERRKKALEAEPNEGHKILANFQKYFDTTIITQNVDNLHERAGSKNVIHLHGELFKSRSTVDENLVYNIDGWEIKLGDKCEKGSQLRPHIVWFGEMVPMMDLAVQKAIEADIFIVVGTSLLVYPAAGLIDYVHDEVPKYIVDPELPPISRRPNLHLFPDIGSVGLKKVSEEIIQHYA